MSKECLKTVLAIDYKYFEMKKILITGGAGFIGSHLVKLFVKKYPEYKIYNLDALSYAGNLENLKDVENEPNYFFIEADIRNNTNIESIFNKYRFDKVIHLAAESHVDRSISDPLKFITTNIVGTATLLEKTKVYWQSLDKEMQSLFRFHHISTDEVYGDLPHPDDTNTKTPLPLFTEASSYAPSSPYSASKASSDHLVRAWSRTFGIPSIITNCSNNYGPKQHPEKLIPKLIYNILNNRPLPIYGRGTNSREWIYVKDHCEALLKVFLKGKIGEFYNIGSNKNLNNLEVCSKLLKVSKKLIKIGSNVKINFVKDRPGHDIRYALNSKKIIKNLGWKPKVNFVDGIKLTFKWYNKNKTYFKNLSKKDIIKRLGKS